MKLVYIAGPFRAATGWRIEQNVRRAERYSLELWKRGIAALCPHANTRLFHGEAPDSVWLDGTMEMLRRCDAVLLISGSESSSGAREEVHEARQLGIPVFEDVDSVERWALGADATDFMKRIEAAIQRARDPSRYTPPEMPKER